VLVIGLGAYTRLMHAGLGCPDWPGCYGFLVVPSTSSERFDAQVRFPEAPIEIKKGWIEMIHRYCAGVLLLVVAGLTFYLSSMRLLRRVRKKPIKLTCELHGQSSDIPRYVKLPFKLPICIFLFVCVQALFGMLTVTLKLWPQIVTMHLLGGFCTLCLLVLLALRLAVSHKKNIDQVINRDKLLSVLGILALVVVVAQVFLGGWTSANYAAFACPSLLECPNDTNIVPDYQHGFNVFQEIGPSYLGGNITSEGRVAIQRVHRAGALVTGLVVLTLLGATMFRLKIKKPALNVGKVCSMVVVALLVQLLLGMLNIVLGLSLGVAVMHNLGAAGLMVSLVVYNYWLYCIREKSLK